MCLFLEEKVFTNNVLKLFYRSHNEARKFTQILAVAAVSFGACIYGTTIVFPAVAGPSLEKSNRTYTLAAEASVADDDNTTSKTYNSSSDNIFFYSYHPDVAPLPFILYPNALAYLGKWSLLIGHQVL